MAQVIPMLSSEGSKAAPPTPEKGRSHLPSGSTGAREETRGDGGKQVTRSHSNAPELNLALQEVTLLSPQRLCFYRVLLSAPEEFS